MITSNLEFYFTHKVFNDGDTILEMAKNRAISINGGTITSGISDGRLLITQDNTYNFDATGMGLTNDCTLECVVKAETDCTVLSFGTLENNKARGIHIFSDGVCGLYKYAGHDKFIGSPSISDGKYHHIVIVCKHDIPIKLYIDGKLSYTSQYNYTYYLATPNNTGIFGVIGDRLQKDKTSGTIEVKTIRVYSSALTQGEILQNYLEELPLQKDEIYVKLNSDNWTKMNF